MELENTLQQLERELQSLSPAAPPRQLTETLHAHMEPVAKRLAPTPIPRSHPWRRLALPAAAAAVAIGIGTTIPLLTPTAPAPTAASIPPVTWTEMPALIDLSAWTPTDFAMHGIQLEQSPTIHLRHSFLQGVSDDTPHHRPRLYFKAPAASPTPERSPITFD